MKEGADLIAILPPPVLGREVAPSAITRAPLFDFGEGGAVPGAAAAGAAGGKGALSEDEAYWLQRQVRGRAAVHGEGVYTQSTFRVPHPSLKGGVPCPRAGCLVLTILEFQTTHLPCHVGVGWIAGAPSVLGFLLSSRAVAASL